MTVTTEQMASIQKVARNLAPKYTFGYYDVDDIEQEAIIFGLRALEAYDASKGAALETFLYTSVRRKLANLKRDKYHRRTFNVDSEELRPSNEAKKNLMTPLDIAHVNSEGERSLSTPAPQLHDAYQREALSLIDFHLPVDLRSDYLKMREGIYVAKQRREEIEHVVRQILVAKGYDDFG